MDDLIGVSPQLREYLRIQGKGQAGDLVFKCTPATVASAATAARFAYHPGLFWLPRHDCPVDGNHSPPGDRRQHSAGKPPTLRGYFGPRLQRLLGTGPGDVFHLPLRRHPHL